MTLFRGELVLALIAIAFISFISTQDATQSHNQVNHFLQPYNHPSSQDLNSPKARAKRMYAMCPPKFQRIGNECYYMSDYKESWLESHFECKDRNSKLAEPLRFADRRLRRFLINNDKSQEDKWIGGMYNWERNQWQWGYNGKVMDYQSFSQMNPGSSDDLKFNCAVLSSHLKFRWSAKACMEKHYFICQHRMPYVSAMSRQKIYARWNETFPNEFANEVEVYISTNGQKTTRKEYYRSVPIKQTNRINSPRVIVKEKFVDREMDIQAQPSEHNLRHANEVAPEYSGFNNPKEQQRPKKFEKNEDIRRRNPFKINGNVDLFNQGINKRRRHRKRLPTTTTTVEPISANEIPEIPLEMPVIREEQIDRAHENRNPERHHNHNIHHTHRTTSTMAPSTSSSTSTTSTTQAPIIVTESPAQIAAHRVNEIKKAKLKRLKEKLAKLSPEEVERFIEMKRKLAEKKLQDHVK